MATDASVVTLEAALKALLLLLLDSRHEFDHAFVLEYYNDPSTFFARVAVMASKEDFACFQYELTAIKTSSVT